MGVTVKQFLGYPRADGTVGARNYVAIIPTVGCVNEVARKISMEVAGTRPILHHQGCGQLPPDLEQVGRVLIGLGTNPNVGAAVVVSLGCEGVPPQTVAEGIAATGRPVSVVSLMELGGYSRAVAAGVQSAAKMVAEIAGLSREPFGVERLIMGIKCGASDTTSGLASNPAIGVRFLTSEMQPGAWRWTRVTIPPSFLQWTPRLAVASIVRPRLALARGRSTPHLWSTT